MSDPSIRHAVPADIDTVLAFWGEAAEGTSISDDHAGVAREDFLIDPSRDRDADVFPTLADPEAAGYSSQAASDLLAVHGPPRVGMAANRYRKDLTASATAWASA
ncbi:hypothetical protein ACF1AN_15090 [Streptomyces griseoluteus]|uniref:GP88 family protein n=1 Tax=Streptomyces griseoluteus TaxID=29306 RepID=UPI0036F9291A